MMSYLASNTEMTADLLHNQTLLQLRFGFKVRILRYRPTQGLECVFVLQYPSSNHSLEHQTAFFLSEV